VRTTRFWNDLHQVTLKIERLERLITWSICSTKTKGPKQDRQNRLDKATVYLCDALTRPLFCIHILHNKPLLDILSSNVWCLYFLLILYFLLCIIACFKFENYNRENRCSITSRQFLLFFFFLLFCPRYRDLFQINTVIRID
jgi:hypothetical protein